MLRLENRMGLSNNKERQAWWQAMNRVYSEQQINAAIATLPPDMQQVILLHYKKGIPLREIAPIVNRSMTAIRTRQVMGIYKLWQYFGKPGY
ncbi:RNA polymerase sigma factor [Niabella ginsenosidivorans]|nr:sigma factor-like helix-turn-helix DNA-binding protein [Niabella ginsenosidivorans]